jgi:hypothetical protein
MDDAGLGGRPHRLLTSLGFAFYQHRLAHDPFWCQRLAWVPQAEAGGPALTEQPPYLWEDMRAQLHEVLAHEQTWQAFLAYLVDPRRALSGETSACQP